MSGSIAGSVFADNNGNNLRDGAEAGFSGVSVTLKTAAGATVATATTDSQGRYSFGGLAAGTYTVNAATPSGKTADSATPPSVTVTDQAVNQDVGFYVPASVHGQVYNDLNRDGTKEGNEAFMVGVTLNLIDGNGAVVATTTSADHPAYPGIYAFDNIKPGSYRIQAVLPGETLAQPLTPISLVSNQQVVLFNAAAVTTPLATGNGSIAGSVFLDDSGNNLRDAGEAGIAGVSVTLKTAAGVTVASATTDGQGRYSFGSLADGTYAIVVATPSGKVADSATPLSVAVAGNAVNAPDAGFYAPAFVHGQIYNDLDRDGTKNGDEAFMIGVKVNLLDQSGAIVATTTSAPEPNYPGIYAFDNIKPGSYRIQAVVPGESLTQPFTPIILHSGQQQILFNASAITTPVGVGNGRIAGTAFLDADADKTLDSGEAGLAGVVVTLKSTGGRTLAVTTTDAQGHYSFASLPDDAYKVLFSAAGFFADNGEPQPITVANQAAVSGVNAGFFKAANISGAVSLASTGALLDGVIVHLLDASGKVVATTTSDTIKDQSNNFTIHGFYSFDNVKPGAYTVQAVIPNAVSPPAPSASIVLTSGQGVTGNIAIQSAALLPGIDSVYGTAFVDANGNGQQDGGEAALANVAVTVKNAAGAAVATATTDADGRYQANGLLDGLYSVSFAPGSGRASDSGSARLSALNPSQSVDGAFYTPATVSGVVFNDANSDGSGAGDNGLGGVIVRLLDAGGATAATTTTGGNGAYSFTGVKPGAHLIQFTTPNGDVATTPTTIDLQQVSGGQGVTANAGFRAAAGQVSLSGTAFLDANGNGVQDGGEAGLAQVSAVLVTSAGTAVQTAVTDAAGHYSFANVANGAYSVTFATPSGDVATSPTTVKAGVLAAGASKTGLDAGFAPDTTPDAGAVPASSVLNIILRGQSNSQYFLQLGMLDKLKADVEAMLGFDGVHQKVNLLGTFFQPDGANTINQGTALIGQWLQPINGDYRNGWQAVSLELGLQTAIARQPADFKAAPTAVIWLHNESDTLNSPNITPDQWQSAARFEAGLVRGLLGQDAGSVPYLFVNAIPFRADNPAADQAIRVGMAALAADPSFGGHIVAQSSDTNMDLDDRRQFFGNHNDLNDALQLEYRLARSLADTFSASAQPGSPLAQAGGHVDNLGPQVIAATTVAGHDDQLLVTVQHDAAITLEALGTGAAQALGWSLRSSPVGSGSALEASGVAARIVDATHLLVTFDSNVQATSKLFYAWGAPRIAPDGQPGTGNAVYDNNHLPIFTNANGVGITNAQAAVPGAISGVAYLDANGTHLVDNDEAGLAGLDVTLTNASGATVGTTTTDQHGAYSFAVATPGSYSVTVTPPDPALLSGGTATQTVTVGSGQNVSNVNAGFYAPATIIGLTLDDGAGYLNGVKVELLNAAGAVVETTSSSGANPLAPSQDGVYSFDDLTPGFYSVRFTAPAGKALVTPAVTSVGALTSGQRANVSGEFAPASAAGSASIAGSVFADDNGNNLRDGAEAAFSGVSVTLKTAAGATVATATTDAQGHYSFGGLAAGTYTVNAATPSGKTADSATPPSVTVTNQAVNQDVGFYAPASVHGQVYNDLNRDGTKEGNEAFMVGVTLNLIDGNGAVVATTTSADNQNYPGIYAFDNVKPGSYQIQAVIPGETLAQPLTPISLVSNQQVVLFNAAAVTTPLAAGNGSIAGAVFLDANRNNVLDAGDGDVGVADYTVVLKGANGAVVGTATSDAQGHYVFSNIADGAYMVAFSDVSQNLVSNVANGARSVTIAGGQAVSNVDAGLHPGGLVYGVGFVDADHNGTAGDGEGVNGETVELIDSQGRVVATTMTDPNNPVIPLDGFYAFYGLEEGSYSVRFTPPAGFALATPGAVAVTVTAGQAAEVDSVLQASVVDTAKPVVSVTAPPARIEATSASGAAVTFAGVASDAVDGADAVVFREGATVVTSGRVFGLGAHTVVASAADAAGNAADPVSFSFTVSDLTKPAVSVTAPAATIAATSAAGAAVAFSGIATDAVDGTDAVVFKEGARVVASGAVFGRGSHIVTASATDAAGNAADPVSFGFTVSDLTKPVVSVTAPAATIAATSAAGAAVSFTAAAIDAVDGTDAVVFREGARVVASGQTFGLGSHIVTASATDAAGNAADPVSFGFAVSDLTKPVVSVMAPSATIAATSAAGAAVTFAGVASDAIDGADAVVFKEGARVVTSGQAFGLGSHTVVASAVDAAGNVADPASFSFTVADLTKPVVSVVAPPLRIEATSAGGAAVSFAAAASDAVDGAAAVVFREGARVVASGQAFGLGSHTVVASAVDAAGNVADPVSFSFTVSDLTKPVVSVTAPAATVQATSASGAAVTFAGLASDAVDGADAVLFKEGARVVASGQVFGLGSHIVTASATDAAGNAADPVSFGFIVTEIPPAMVSGRAIDGYLAGATVFADANRNGKADAGEIRTTTDAQGNYALAAGSARLVVQGGFDIGTKLAFTGTLTAPAGSSVVTPLTTLVDQVAGANGGDVPAAQARVKAAFGLSASIDLDTLDPIAATQAGQAGASRALTVGAALLNTASLIAASGATGDVFAALASRIAGSSAPIDLTSVATLTALAKSAGASDAGAGASGAVAGASNLLLAQKAQTAGSDAARLLADVTAVSATAQGGTVAALTIAGGDAGLLSKVVDANTGVALADKVGLAGASPVAAANHAPTAFDDNAALALHRTVTGNLLANDADPDAGDPLSIAAVRVGAGPDVAAPANGRVTLDSRHGHITVGADGAYAFVADHRAGLAAADTATDSFTYTVADGHGGAAAGHLSVSVTQAAPAASESFAFAFTQASLAWRAGSTLLTGPDGVTHDVTGVAALTFADGAIQEKDGAPLVDDLFYYARNLDVWAAHMDPEAHYALYGWREGRDPDGLFSTAGYLNANPDVAAAGINPLQHYDQHGWQEGRSPGAGFSTAAYLAANPDVAAAHVDPLAHYLAFGQEEGRSALPDRNGPHLTGDFDAAYYLAHNPDVAAAAPPGAGADAYAFQHYLAYGAKEGRDPDALFSTRGYLAANPDVAAAGLNPLLHYEAYGWREGRDPGGAFHTAAYLAANPDVAAAGIDPLQHYLQYGSAEGRNAS